MEVIYEHLMDEHRTVEQILERIDETTERAEKKREELLLKLRKNLVVHMKSEEKVLYPVLLDNKETKELALEAIEEHNVAASLLRELDVTPKDSEKWHAKFSVFMENVTHHVEEEEGELFPTAHKVLGPDKEGMILEGYLKEEERQKNSLMRRIERKIRETV